MSVREARHHISLRLSCRRSNQWYIQDLTRSGTVAGHRPDRVAEHVPECDPLTQFEELGVDREGGIFDGRADVNGLTCAAVSGARCLSVRDFESGRVQKYASQRSKGHRSATGVCADGVAKFALRMFSFTRIFNLKLP